MGGGQGEEKGWPVEVMVGVGEDGVITLLKRCACVCLAYHTSLSFHELCSLHMLRDSYRSLYTYRPQPEETLYPGTRVMTREFYSLFNNLS